ncbi:MAG: hypothetical protein WAU01_06580 [Saprospiraceae bacterium]
MKNNKLKKENKDFRQEEKELTLKAKKKPEKLDHKVNIKSNKFWKEVMDDEGDDIEKFIR